jgi:hypothetical protein
MEPGSSATRGARRAFEKIGPDSLTLDSRSRKILDDARISSTPGFGARHSGDDVAHVLSNLPEIHRWMGVVMAKVSVQ